MTAPSSTDFRVLMIPSSSRDESVLQKLLTEDGHNATFVKGIHPLVEELRKGCGVAIIPVATLLEENATVLAQFIAAQPNWSNLPIIFLSAAHDRHLSDLYQYGNVTILQQPLHFITLLSAVRSALASRKKQLELRGLLDREAEIQEYLRLADRRKDEFLAMLAHELRNPLSPLQSALDLLEVSRDDPSHWAELRGIMSRQIVQMVRLIDDLMDVSRINRGKLNIVRGNVELADSILAGIEAAQPFIDASHQSLILDIEAAPMVVNGDSARLSQIVTNLLNNASKYTPEGGSILVSAEKRENDFEIVVQDDGIGIEPEVSESIFDLFQQFDTERERGKAGLGIGLSLVKRLVELHDGRISVQSDGRDQGARFIIRLPAATPTEGSRPDSQSRDDSTSYAFRILVVEDIRAIRTVMAKLITAMGHTVQSAENGEEGVKAAREHQPEIVISDISMPVMSGYEMARCFREDAQLKHVYMIAMTGYGQEQDRKKAIDSGFDAHVTKPVSLDQLRELFNNFHEQRRES